MTATAGTDGGVERRIVTVLFVDLVGFTELAESFDAEDVARVQSAYFSAVREIIARYGGRVEKFIGDAAMAVFGLPRSRDDDAERAVRAGLALAGAVEQLASELGLPESALRIRVGVNTGEVVAGTGDALVTGDTVNVAARLQAAAPVGGPLAGETTSLAVADAIELEPLEALALKGKTEPVRAALATGVRPERSRELAMGALRSPLLGREPELDALGAARDWGGRLVVVAPPGVGKTRLVDEFARSCDGAIWRARVRPGLGPYQPIAQLLTSAGRVRRSLVRAAATAAGATTVRAEVVAAAVDALVEPEAGASRIPADRRALFGAWLEAAEALEGRKPTLWLVEDVHWASADLLAFLELAGRSRLRLVLATARPSLLGSDPGWCDNVLHLPPLRPQAIGTLVQALVPDALPRQLVDAVADRAGGNPLFVEELLRVWISVGVLTRDGAGWRLAAPADEVPLPATVQAIYAAQLDDLPEPARAVARRASVAGRRFPDAALAILGVTAAREGLAGLERRAFVEAAAPDPLVGPTHAYRHALLRDAGYASLSRAERVRLHVRLAQWLERTAGTRWPETAEAIAQHYLAALETTLRVSPEIDRDDMARRAAEWFERAAGVALELAAHESARVLVRRALELTDERSTEDLARRWELLARATAYAADMAEGAKAMRTALDLFRAAGDETGAARTGAALGMIMLEQLRFDEADELATQLIQQAGGAGEEAVAELLLLRAAANYSRTNDWRHTADDRDRAIAIARRHGNRSLELHALGWLVGFHALEPEALLHVDLAEIVELAMREGAPKVAAAAWESVAMSCVLHDRAEDAAEPAARAHEIAEAHGVVEEVAWAAYSRCEAGFVSGDWDAAVTAGTAALELAETNAYNRVGIRTLAALNAIAAARRDDTMLKRHLAWYEPRRPALPRSPFGVMMITAFDRRFANAGLIEPREPEGTLACWDVRLRHPSWYASLEEVLAAWLEAGRVAEARAGLERYEETLNRWSSALARGVAALMRARLEEDGFADAALREFRAVPAPWWETKALRLLGRDAEAACIEEQLGIAPNRR